MARSAPAISTFTAGEISPRLEGRVTIEKYREGLSELTNMIVQPHGGVTRRPGTEYLGEVKNSSNATRLIPFEFKTADTYALEFGDQYMRVSATVCRFWLIVKRMFQRSQRLILAFSQAALMV